MLVRDRDGLMNRGDLVKFVEWQSPELGSKFKELHDEPQIGFSVIIDPHRFSYTWLTTPITEIISDTVDKDIRCIEFKTENSNYKLYTIIQ